MLSKVITEILAIFCPAIRPSFTRSAGLPADGLLLKTSDGAYHRIRFAVEGAGDQLLRGRLVDVALDEHRIGRLGGLVLRLRRQELVLQVGREQTAGGREDDNEQQGESAAHVLSLCPPYAPGFRRSGDLGGHELAEPTKRTELQRTDRAFVLAEHGRDLTARHVLDEPQHEDLLLLDRQVLHGAA